MNNINIYVLRTKQKQRNATIVEQWREHRTNFAGTAGFKVSEN